MGSVSKIPVIIINKRVAPGMSHLSAPMANQIFFCTVTAHVADVGIVPYLWLMYANLITQNTIHSY